MTTSTQTQLRRGTAAQVAAMTPALGETVVNTTDTRLHTGDGTTPGGIPHANASDVQKQKFIYPTVGGTGDDITLTNTPPISGYGAGLKQIFKAGAANTTTAVRANVDGKGWRNLTKIAGGSIVPLAIGDLVSGGIYELDDDGTELQVKGGLGSGGALPAAVTGDLSTTTSFAVDFTTYSAYDIMVEDLTSSASTGFDIAVSTNGGSTYSAGSLNALKMTTSATTTPVNMGATGGGRTSQFVGTLTQATPTGSAAMVFSGGDESSITVIGNVRYSLGAAIDHISVVPAGGSISTGNIVLQPKAKR